MIVAAFLDSAPVQVALAVSGAAAAVCAVVGVFTVLRGQAFAGHALGDISSAGGAAALLFGIRPLAGFVAMALGGAVAMALGEGRRIAERDLASGVVLGAGLGVAALFLYLDATTGVGGGAASTVMFGSMFAIPAAMVGPAAGCAAVALAGIGLMARPLLLVAIDPALAASRGVKVRWLGFMHLAVLALAVGLAAMTVGAILATALLIGPAATGLRAARTVPGAVAIAVGAGLAACWGGIVLAYASYGWGGHRGWPVSVFVVALVLAFYLASGLAARAGRRG